MSIRRSVIAVAAAALLVVSVTSPAFAYGKENWQVAFSGTGVNPGTGQAFGFWGWCAFGGGVTSGNDADCEFSQYLHLPSGPGFTCQESLDVSAWSISPTTGDFVVTGTATVHPSTMTVPCLALFPGTTTNTFSNIDTQIPAAAGHYNLGSIFGARGEFVMQVVQLK